jgi:hypothetical protein
MVQDTLARRMFLVLHDPFTGKPAIGHDLLKCGLVAGALGDLMLERRLGMENDRIVVADPRSYGVDELGAFVVESIQRQASAHTVRSWVEALIDVVYELVARGLIADAVVRREPGGRRLLRRGADRFPAVDLLRAARPRVHLEHMLRVPDDRDVAGRTLAGIIRALEVERVLDVDRDRTAVKNDVAEAAEHLPIDLRGLVDGVEAAVSAISLTVRR